MYGEDLSDAFNLQRRLVLSVSTNRVHPLLSLVTNARYFVCLHILFDDFSCYDCLVYARRADFDGVTVNSHECVKAHTCAVALYKLNFERFALDNHILLATGLNNCFFSHED